MIKVMKWTAVLVGGAVLGAYVSMVAWEFYLFMEETSDE